MEITFKKKALTFLFKNLLKVVLTEKNNNKQPILLLISKNRTLLKFYSFNINLSLK